MNYRGTHAATAWSSCRHQSRRQAGGLMAPGLGFGPRFSQDGLTPSFVRRGFLFIGRDGDFSD